MILSVRGSPLDLRVFNETVSSMRLSWRAATGNVLQYNVAYKPDGGERKEINVKGDTTFALLKNLLPDTDYELFVSARYSSGLGDPLLGTGTTLEGKRPGYFFFSHVCDVLSIIFLPYAPRINY